MRYTKFKLPVSNRTSASRTPSPEAFDAIQLYDGEYVAYITEAPYNPSNGGTPMVVTVTVSGSPSPRTYQNDSNPVEVGKFKVKTTPVNLANGTTAYQHRNVLVFNAADNGRTGTADYYRTGTVQEGMTWDMLKDFLTPIMGYESLSTLTSAVPPHSTDMNTRGYPGDQAILNDGTPAHVIPDGSVWAVSGASTVNQTPSLAAIGAQYLTVGNTAAIAVVITDEDPDGCTVTATSSNQSVCPNASLAVTGSGANRSLDISALDGAGTAIITLTVSDGSLQSQRTFNLNSVATQTYTLTVGHTGSGTVSPGTTTLPSGSSQSFSITPDTGYYIQDVTVDGVTQGAVAVLNMSNVLANHTISATFAVYAYLIDTSNTGSGTVSPDETITYGSAYGVTGTAGAGMFIKDVVVDSVTHLGAQSSPYTYTFSNVQAAHTIAFTFGNDSPSWTSASISSYMADGFVIEFVCNDAESQVLSVQQLLDSGSWTSPASGRIKNLSNATVEYNAIASGTTYRLTIAGLSGSSHTCNLRVNDGVTTAVQLNSALTATIPAPSTPVISVTPGALHNTISLTSGGTPASSYNIKWGTVSGSRTTTITGVTLPYSHNSLTAGTTYYYSVVAVNTAGTTESSEGSGLVTSLTTTDSFNDSSIDSSLWGVVTSGGGTAVETTYLALTSTDAQRAYVWYKTPISKTEKRKYTVTFNVTNTIATTTPPVHLMYSADPSALPSDASPDTRMFEIGAAYTNVSSWWFDSSNVTHHTNGSGGVNGTTYKAVFYIDPDNARAKADITASNDTVIASSDWQALTALRSGTDPLYIVLGDYLTIGWASGIRYTGFRDEAY